MTRSTQTAAFASNCIGTSASKVLRNVPKDLVRTGVGVTTGTVLSSSTVAVPSLLIATGPAWVPMATAAAVGGLAVYGLSKAWDAIFD